MARCSHHFPEFRFANLSCCHVDSLADRIRDKQGEAETVVPGHCSNRRAGRTSAFRYASPRAKACIWGSCGGVNAFIGIGDKQGEAVPPGHCTNASAGRTPTPLRILVSAFVHFDPEQRVTDILMFNSKNLGALIVDEDPHVKSWEDGQYNILNMSIEGTYGFGILNEGQAIAVAKNVKVRPNEFVMPARTVFNLSEANNTFPDLSSEARSSIWCFHPVPAKPHAHARGEEDSRVWNFLLRPGREEHVGEHHHRGDA